MTDRVSLRFLLCEDDLQESLVIAYLNCCGIATDARNLVRLNASRRFAGGNVGSVLAEFSKWLSACRSRNAKARTLLIALADADDHSVQDRLRQFQVKEAYSSTDPVVILIPRRHVETWIRCAQCQSVNETDSYKRPEPRKADWLEAARTIYGWARNSPQPAATCVPSLLSALPEWRKIG